MAKTSRLFLTEVQEAYLTWLLTPDDSKAPKTKKDWAELHDVHINTLGLWEKNKVFKERWELGVKGMAQSPERTQALLDALYAKGVCSKCRLLILIILRQLKNLLMRSCIP